MNIPEELNITELEQLARAYLDCRLSLTEERELALLLFSTGASSALLDEVRAEMGVELLAGAMPFRRRRRLSPWLTRVAACLVLLLSTAIAIHLDNRHRRVPEYVCVIIDGRELTHDEAARAAAEIESSSLAMLHEAMNSEQDLSLRMMNEILQTR